MTTAINEKRPAPASTGLRGSRAASKRNHGQSKGESVKSRSNVTGLPTRLEWAAGLIDRATGFIPEYGSPEFDELDDKDPHKVASCVRAAEAWRIYFSPEEIAFRTRIELDEARRYEQEPGVWTQDVVDSVHRSARQPSYAALSRLRGEPDKEAQANVHRRRMGLPVDERAPKASCKDVGHDWAIFTITTDWPQDEDNPRRRRCRRCLDFGPAVPNLRVVQDA